MTGFRVFNEDTMSKSYFNSCDILIFQYGSTSLHYTDKIEQRN